MNEMKESGSRRANIEWGSLFFPRFLQIKLRDKMRKRWRRRACWITACVELGLQKSAEAAENASFPEVPAFTTETTTRRRRGGEDDTLCTAETGCV